MADFLDKKGRTISIEVDGECAYAWHDGKKVGELITTGWDEIDDYAPPTPPEITDWEVDAEYRRAGIATELVKQLVDDVGMLIPAKRNEGRGGENALTDEGLALTIHCQNLGLIHKFPEDQDYEDWMDDPAVDQD